MPVNLAAIFGDRYPSRGEGTVGCSAEPPGGDEGTRCTEHLTKRSFCTAFSLANTLLAGGTSLPHDCPSLLTRRGQFSVERMKRRCILVETSTLQKVSYRFTLDQPPPGILTRAFRC